MSCWGLFSRLYGKNFNNFFFSFRNCQSDINFVKFSQVKIDYFYYVSGIFSKSHVELWFFQLDTNISAITLTLIHPRVSRRQTFTFIVEHHENLREGMKVGCRTRRLNSIRGSGFSTGEGYCSWRESNSHLAIFLNIISSQIQVYLNVHFQGL